MPSIFDESDILDVAPESLEAGSPLAFTVPDQEKSEWCWAAVGSGVRAFYEKQQLQRPCEIANEFVGGDCCANPDSCNVAQSLAAVLKDMGYRTIPPKEQVEFDVIKSEIDADRPVCCFIDFGTEIGHFVALTAYDQDLRQVGVIDPAPGEAHDDPRMIPFASFRIDYNGGRWRETYLTQPRN